MKLNINWKKSKLLIFGGITLVLAGYVFVNSLNLSPFYLEGATFWCFAFTAYVLAGVFFHYGELFTIKTKAEQEGPYRVVPQLKLPKWAIWTVAVPWAFLLLMNIVMSPLLSYPAYRDQLGTPEVREFTGDVQVMDMDQLPVVDKDLAAKLADKKLGERPSLGSQVYLGEPTIQQVNGKLVWAVPLQHSGFFKWLTNMEGTPGYIVVSATNPNDVEYVDQHLIKYQPNSSTTLPATPASPRLCSRASPTIPSNWTTTASPIGWFPPIKTAGALPCPRPPVPSSSMLPPAGIPSTALPSCLNGSTASSPKIL